MPSSTRGRWPASASCSASSKSRPQEDLDRALAGPADHPRDGRRGEDRGAAGLRVHDVRRRPRRGPPRQRLAADRPSPSAASPRSGRCRRHRPGARGRRRRRPSPCTRACAARNSGSSGGARRPSPRTKQRRSARRGRSCRRCRRASAARRTGRRTAASSGAGRPGPRPSRRPSRSTCCGCCRRRAERVVELGVGEAARVVRRGEREEGGLTAGELEQRRPHPASVADLEERVLLAQERGVADALERAVVCPARSAGRAGRCACHRARRTRR